MTLARALAYAEAGDWSSTAQALLAAWREVPAAPIAATLLTVTQRAMPSRIAGLGKSETKDNARWMRVTKRGDVVELYVQCITLPHARRSAEVTRRIEALLAFAPDPRIARAVCELVTRPKYSVLDPDLFRYWERLWAWLLRLGDPRVVTWIADATWETEPPAQRERLIAHREQHLPGLRAEYGLVPVIGESDRALCDRIVEITKSPTTRELGRATREAGLLANIYAAPTDDTPRAVYADWLQEQDDPRGEYISLALLAELSADQKARKRELESTHGRAWMAPITVGDLDRGFIAVSRERTPLPVDTRLKTLVTSHTAPSADMELPALRTLVLDNGGIRQLATLSQPLPVEHLDWSGLAEVDGRIRFGSAAPIDAFAQIRVLPELHTLRLALDRPAGVSGHELRSILGARFVENVRTLQVGFAPWALREVLEISAHLPLDSLELRSRRVGLVLSRDELRLGILELSIDETAFESSDLVTMIEGLEPDQLSSIDVTVRGAIDRAWMERLQNAARAQHRVDGVVFHEAERNTHDPAARIRFADRRRRRP